MTISASEVHDAPLPRDRGSAQPARREMRLPLRPLQTVMLFVFAATAGSGYLLLSAAESKTLIDGAIAWQANSPLRAVVQILCLNYEFPTIHAGDVKNYFLGMGTGLALLALTVAVLSRSRPGDELPVPELGPADDRRLGARHRFGPLAAAQALVGCYVLWSFASSRWSSAAPLAIGGSILLTIFFLWSFCLGHGLGRSGAKIATRIVIILGTVSAAVAIWYYYGRNPVIAAKFPFGNPSFLATCLIPPIVLAVALIFELLSGLPRSAGNTLYIVLALIAIAACVWAFDLARSRGPAVGLAFGALSIWFFAARGKWKTLPAIVALVCIAAGVWYIVQFAHAPSPTGRSATLRSRLYTWEYAWRMFVSKPLTGAGQGGFALHGDAYVAEDILDDPLAFVGRSTHAHNEWLEVLSDLGVVGFVLIGGALLLTFWAGMRKARAPGQVRWPLIGSLAALLGLCAAECFGVGLEVAEVPTAFYSLLGLIWAFCAADPSPVLTTAAATSGRRVGTGAIGGIIGLVVLSIAQSDFQSAQSAYASIDLLKAGQGEQAIERAADSVLRLSPQRALENHYRLIQTHLAVAEKLMLAGIDRAARAVKADPPDQRLLFMSQQDLQASDEHVTLASQQLKELISRSPGYIDHGRLEARINLIRAESATARGDNESRDKFVRNAAAAIERELRRQPFDPDLAVEYGQIAGPTAKPEDLLSALARPLRHNRISEHYVDLLQRLVTQTDFGNSLDSVGEQLRSEPPAEPMPAEPTPAKQTPDWRPEKLRLAATVHFLRGDFEGAEADLAPACRAYEPMHDRAPLGAAACFAEWADARFFSRPDQAKLAVESAQRALDYAPESEAGRELKSLVRQRMIHYSLAAGDFDAAVALLKLVAPPEVSQADLDAELAARTRRMIESLVRNRGDWLSATAEGRAMLQTFDSLFLRTAAQVKDDGAAHVLGVQLGILEKDPDRVVDHLRRALELGLGPDAAQTLLQSARNAGLDSPALTILGQAVEGAIKAAEPPATHEITPAPPTADEGIGAGG